MHHAHADTILFAVANLVIVAGYLAVPFLVLPYLPLPRHVVILGAGFFLGCAGTHVWMACESHGGWFWTVWHLAQAACTWGFILTFRRRLQRAAGRRTRGGGGAR